jgi:hypothetical protein
MQGAHDRIPSTRWPFLHRAAVLAIAEALMIYRTLDAAMIDTIIASAPERGRRADWSEVLKSRRNSPLGWKARSKGNAVRGLKRNVAQRGWQLVGFGH